MKKKSIILIGVLLISFVLMASASANYSQTISKDQCEGRTTGEAVDTLFEFTQAPTPRGDGTLTVSIQGDYSGATSERVGVLVEGEFLGYVPESGYYDDCLCYLLTRTFTVSQQQLSKWKADGKIEVTVVQAYGTSSNVDCFCKTEYCSCGDYSKCAHINEVTLEYQGANNSLPMQQFMKILGFGKEK
ncbi:MAG TPA: hypothetical protein PKH80_01930 [Methanofastidiosum sp.]|nr:hypothetical protein [Methanofastidiosum sp.]HNU61239.1 hypothetical protein [Methanofastidiosum sp.]